MAAYMLVQGTINDEDRYGEYRSAVVPLIAAFGGKHIRSGPVELLEGSRSEVRTALFEFPSMEEIRAFWNSPEYYHVKKLRDGAAILEIWAIPGL